MTKTPVSLLERLRQPGDSDAWRRFVHIYTPLLFHWAKRLGLRGQDAADLVQDVFLILVQKLPQFGYDQHKRFRGWLWTIIRNKFLEQRRRRKIPMAEAGAVDLVELAGPVRSKRSPGYSIPTLSRRTMRTTRLAFISW